MLRFSFVVLMGIYTAGAASAAPWADGMFDALNKDFGSTPRGPTLTHPFRLTNTTGSPVHIAGIRVSCGCVTAVPLHTDLAPGQTSAILVQMDTRRFFGAKTVTIFVQFDRPRWEEVRLWVQANSRDDVNLNPDVLAFGHVKRGSSPTAAVTVTFVGNGQWQVTDARCESNYVQPTVVELRRDPGTVVYQVTARLRVDAPVGKWYSDLWLQTNNPVSPRVRIPLTVEVESALSVTPSAVYLGSVKAGAEAERKVIVRGVRPFRITEVKGADGPFTVRDSTEDSKSVHVLTVTVKGDQPGELAQTLRIVTDLKEEGEIEIQARADILP